MFDADLPECLSHTSSPVFRDFVHMIVGDVESVLRNRRICPETLPRPYHLSYIPFPRLVSQRVLHRTKVHHVPVLSIGTTSSSWLNSICVKSLNGAFGFHMMLCVHAPVSSALFTGVVRLLLSGTAEMMLEGAEEGRLSEWVSKRIWSSQFERSTRSKDRSWRVRSIGTSVCCRSCGM